MAGAGAKLFTSGSVLTAAQVNTFLMDQTIMTFASTTTRDAAFGGVGEPTLAEGMFAYTTDTNTLWSYNGSSWVSVLGSDIGAISTDNRNVIINGAMQVTQRSAVGTAVTGITTVGYNTADRWQTILASLGTWSQTTIADAPTGSGFRNSLKMACTTADASPAAGDVLLIQQKLEGQNVQSFCKGTASAKPFTLSFWVKSFQTGTFIAEIEDTDNTRSVSKSYTVDVSNTWEYKSITFPADTTGAFDNDANASMNVNWFLGAGTTYTSGTLATTWASTTSANRAVGQTNAASSTSNTWQVTGIQLEVGSVATPFEFEQFTVTLEKCKRYYEKTYEYASAPGTATGIGYVGWGGPDSVASLYVFPSWRYSVEKRGTPTITVYDTSGNSGKITTWQSGAPTTNVTPSSASWATGTTQTATLVQGAYSGFQYHVVASSEL